MMHIHKTAGTSMVSAFSSLRSRGAKTYRHTVYWHGKSDEQNKKWWEMSSDFLDGTVKYQNEWGPKEHTLIGVVRDPVERFISAAGQAMGGLGSSSNGIAPILNSECIQETSRETLRCLINTVKKNSTWIEVHFTPLILEISFATMNKDIPVALFPFSEVPALMYELGADPTSKRKVGATTRKHDVMKDMSVQDYDEDMLRDVCEIYRIDILFLRYIGYATRCDSYIKFN
mmetsp:Transcript_6427/g.9338  ORF Transcript_6427/g.9338 Transcript_6427/m.9338 type:complete len:230 (+) Transcript_6427:1082-1771(+)